MLRNEVGFSIIRDEVFKASNDALATKLKALKKDVKGNKPNANEALTDEVIEKLWQTGVFGSPLWRSLDKHNFPEYLQHFGFRGRQEHHQLKSGDVGNITTNGHKCVQWSVEMLRKILEGNRSCREMSVLFYEEYVANRPAEMCQKSSAQI